VDSRGFPPIARADARVLVLGSLPGQESLRRRQYYAQPRNAFWSIMGELFGAAPTLPYARRVARLRSRRVAVWDVCARAFRAGSLDASIVPGSVIVNDFAAFFASHPRIRLVCLNGAKAEALYRRCVLPALAAPAAALPLLRLPSTSPAHAARPFAAKLAAWRAVSAAAAPRGRRPQPATQAADGAADNE
jgi:double-stranded uracil-DNA glycosylase